MLKPNSKGDYPQLEDSVYVDSTAVIIGAVKISQNVFIGPGAVIRADEAGSSILIKDNCNIQDRVIIHALENSSVLIEEKTSLAHGSIIHGPCKIGKNCFVGFGSVVFKAEICDGVCIKHLVVVEDVMIMPERIIESHSLINCKEDSRELKHAGKNYKVFMEKVIKANLDLTKRYNEKRDSDL